MNTSPALTRTVTPRSDRISLSVPPSFVGKRFAVSFYLIAQDEPAPPSPRPPDIPESLRRKLPKFAKAQIEAWRDDPDIKAFAGILKDAGLPPDITMKDIRGMRLKKRYGI